MSLTFWFPPQRQSGFLPDPSSSLCCLTLQLGWVCTQSMPTFHFHEQSQLRIGSPISEKWICEYRHIRTKETKNIKPESRGGLWRNSFSRTLGSWSWRLDCPEIPRHWLLSPPCWGWGLASDEFGSRTQPSWCWLIFFKSGLLFRWYAFVWL